MTQTILNFKLQNTKLTAFSKYTTP